MAKAMQEVEKLRLEMQRANERVQAAQGVEGTVIKKKKKKTKTPEVNPDNEGLTTVAKKKKKVKKAEESTAVESEGVADVVKPKKRKKTTKIDGDATGQKGTVDSGA